MEMALPALFRFSFIWSIQDPHDPGHKELIARQEYWGSWETAQYKKAHDLNQIRDSQKTTTFNGWVVQVKVFILRIPMSLRRWNGSYSGQILKQALCTLWEGIYYIAPSCTGVPTHSICWTCTSQQQQSHGWIFPYLLFCQFFIFLLFFLFSCLSFYE